MVKHETGCRFNWYPHALYRTIFPLLCILVPSSLPSRHNRLQWRSSPPPLFLDLTEAQRETGPPPHLRVWITAPPILPPPPPLSEYLDPPLHWAANRSLDKTVLRPWNEWTNKRKSVYIKSYQVVSVNQTWKDKGCPRPYLTTLITVKKINSNLCTVSIVPTLCKSATHVDDNKYLYLNQCSALAHSNCAERKFQKTLFWYGRMPKIVSPFFFYFFSVTEYTDVKTSVFNSKLLIYSCTNKVYITLSAVISM